MKWIIGYVICPLVGGVIIWHKQGRFLTEDQPFAFLLLGPVMPLVALLPKRYFTNRKEQQGSSK